MIQELRISIEQSPRQDLERQGYVCFKGSDLSVPQHLQEDLNSLRRDYETLPLDQYCESGNRHRRHSRYVLLPWLNLLEARPISHFTFIHLIERHGITGGESLVADNDKRPLVRMTLDDRLDTVTLSDKDVYHHVEPIEVAPGESEGYRDVLLIDFTPMHPVTLRALESM